MRREGDKKSEIFSLPSPELPRVDFSSVLLKRRSKRDFIEKVVEIRKFSALLFSANGITGRKYGINLRTSPSAGATYPVDLVVFTNRVEGVEKALWLYIPENHSLHLLKRGDFSSEITEIALNQDEVKRSAITFIMFGVIERIFPRYGERSIRYIFLECGHISQNIYLMSEALGLGSVAIGAFYDKDLAELVGYNPKKVIPAYIHLVGYTKE